LAAGTTLQPGDLRLCGRFSLSKVSFKMRHGKEFGRGIFIEAEAPWRWSWESQSTRSVFDRLCEAEARLTGSSCFSNAAFLVSHWR